MQDRNLEATEERFTSPDDILVCSATLYFMLIACTITQKSSCHIRLV